MIRNLFKIKEIKFLLHTKLQNIQSLNTYRKQKSQSFCHYTYYSQLSHPQGGQQREHLGTAIHRWISSSLSTKADGLNSGCSIPRPHMAEAKNKLSSCPLTTHVPWCMYPLLIQINKYMLKNKTKKLKRSNQERVNTHYKQEHCSWNAEWFKTKKAVYLVNKR